VASPGIGVLFTLAADLSRGWHASVVAAFGCTWHRAAPAGGGVGAGSVAAHQRTGVPAPVVFVGYGLFAASVRDYVISRPRVLTWMRRHLRRRLRRPGL
jgi:threonine/homoserine/homoserine lactone efflux protein